MAGYRKWIFISLALIACLLAVIPFQSALAADSGQTVPTAGPSPTPQGEPTEPPGNPPPPADPTATQRAAQPGSASETPTVTSTGTTAAAATATQAGQQPGPGQTRQASKTAPTDTSTAAPTQVATGCDTPIPTVVSGTSEAGSPVDLSFLFPAGLCLLVLTAVFILWLTRRDAKKTPDQSN